MTLIAGEMGTGQEGTRAPFFNFSRTLKQFQNLEFRYKNKVKSQERHIQQRTTHTPKSHGAGGRRQEYSVVEFNAVCQVVQYNGTVGCDQ